MLSCTAWKMETRPPFLSAALSTEAAFGSSQLTSPEPLWSSGKKTHVQSLNPWPLLCFFSSVLCKENKSAARRRSLCMKQKPFPSMTADPLYHFGTRDVHFATLLPLHLFRNYSEPAVRYLFPRVIRGILLYF